MVQRSEDVSFTREPCEALGILGERVWQNLERHVASELRVPRSIHFTHPACTERRDDLIRTQSKTCAKGHEAPPMRLAYCSGEVWEA